MKFLLCLFTLSFSAPLQAQALNHTQWQDITGQWAYKGNNETKWDHQPMSTYAQYDPQFKQLKWVGNDSGQPLSWAILRPKKLVDGPLHIILFHKTSEFAIWGKRTSLRGSTSDGQSFLNMFAMSSRTCEKNEITFPLSKKSIAECDQLFYGPKGRINWPRVGFLKSLDRSQKNAIIIIPWRDEINDNDMSVSSKMVSNTYHLVDYLKSINFIPKQANQYQGQFILSGYSGGGAEALFALSKNTENVDQLWLLDPSSDAYKKRRIQILIGLNNWAENHPKGKFRMISTMNGTLQADLLQRQQRWPDLYDLKITDEAFWKNSEWYRSLVMLVNPTQERSDRIWIRHLFAASGGTTANGIRKTFFEQWLDLLP